MQNHNDDTIKTSDTVIRKIYLSLYLKGLCVRGSWRPNRTATYWLPLLWPQQRFFPVLLGFSTGGLGAQPLWVLVFSTASYLQLVWSPTGLISKLQLLNRGPEGSLCWVLAFATASCLQLVWSPNRTELYNSLTLIFFLWASQIALIQPVHGQSYNSDIPRPDVPVIYTGAFPILAVILFINYSYLI